MSVLPPCFVSKSSEKNSGCFQHLWKALLFCWKPEQTLLYNSPFKDLWVLAFEKVQELNCLPSQPCKNLVGVFLGMANCSGAEVRPVHCLGLAHQLRRWLHTTDRHLLKTLCHPRSRETRIKQEHPQDLIVRESKLLMSSADSRQLTSLLSGELLPICSLMKSFKCLLWHQEILNQDWHWPESRLWTSSNMILRR